MYNLPFTMYNLQGTIYKVQFTLYNVPCTIYNVFMFHMHGDSSLSILHTSFFPLPSPSSFFTLHTL